MTEPSRRTFAPVVLAGLGTAGLTAVAAGRPWVTAEPKDREAAWAVGSVASDITGADVAPLVLPLALVALAAWGAILVLRRRGRRVVATLGVLASAGAAAAAALRATTATDVAAEQLGDVTADLATTAWPWIALVGALLSTGSFVLAWRAAPAWPEMSARYDAPTDAPRGRTTAGSAGDGEADSRELWKALDEGEDPTT